MADPVLPPDLGRIISDYERRIRDLENRRTRPVNVLPDLRDVAVTYGGGDREPVDGDVLVFDGSLGDAGSPGGRWRPGAGGGGGGGEYSSGEVVVVDGGAWLAWEFHSLGAAPIAALDNEWGRGVVVGNSGVWHVTASVECGAGDAQIQIAGPPVSIPGYGQCISNAVSDSGGLTASVSSDFPVPALGSVTCWVDLSDEQTWWGVTMTAHLVHPEFVMQGSCG